ncbi:MAG: hypothetical protein LBT51_05025 [Fusobacteriaceae bacterium]|jgi:hypothetical protein|nr:hypothetical protein [Fusobacteriaceae bacterium]
MKKFLTVVMLVIIAMTSFTSCTNEEILGAGLITTGVLVAASNPSPSYSAPRRTHYRNPPRRGYRRGRY